MENPELSKRLENLERLVLHLTSEVESLRNTISKMRGISPARQQPKRKKVRNTCRLCDRGVPHRECN